MFSMYFISVRVHTLWFLIAHVQTENFENVNLNLKLEGHVEKVLIFSPFVFSFFLGELEKCLEDPEKLGSLFVKHVSTIALLIFCSGYCHIYSLVCQIVGELAYGL